MIDAVVVAVVVDNAVVDRCCGNCSVFRSWQMS